MKFKIKLHLAIIIIIFIIGLISVSSINLDGMQTDVMKSSNPPETEEQKKKESGVSLRTEMEPQAVIKMRR